MTDRFGNELNIGDLCVCYSNMGTGSSTRRLVQYEAEIIGFTPNFVKVKCLKCGYSEKTGREFRCYPDNVFKINPVGHGKWNNALDNYQVAECSKCNEWFEISPYEKPNKDFFDCFCKHYNFCPSCGADMRGERNEID